MTHVEQLQGREDGRDVENVARARVRDLNRLHRESDVRRGAVEGECTAVRTMENTVARIGMTLTTPMREDRAALVHVQSQ